MSNLVQTDKGDIKLTPEIVKKYLVNGNGNVTDQEVVMFLSLCKFQKLNPFLREAYLIKFGSAPATIVVGKEVFTKRASNLENCEGWEAGVIVTSKDSGELTYRQGSFVLSSEELVGGWCKVYRKGWKTPMEAQVSLQEYDKKQSVWKEKPATMIRKVAIVQALRDAFPDDFQGMYDTAEMPVQESQLSETPINVESVEVVENDNKITSEQVKRLYTIANGNNDLAKNVLKKYGLDSSKDITKEDYDKICEEIENEVNKAS